MILNFISKCKYFLSRLFGGNKSIGRSVQMRSGGVTIITYPGVRNHRNGCNPINFRTINMNGVTPKAL